MIKRSIYFILGVLLLACTKPESVKWTVLLEQPNTSPRQLVVLPPNGAMDTSIIYDSIQVNIALVEHDGYKALTASATAIGTSKKCYITLQATYNNGKAWNYNGQVYRTEIYRQSPHDLDAWITDSLAKQAIPMVAIQGQQGFDIAVNNSPVYYNNYCSQYFNLSQGELNLSSGDNGQTPGMKPESFEMPQYNAEKGQRFTPGKVTEYYHYISPSQAHKFEAILLKSKATDINKLRRDVVLQVAKHWSQGRYTDYMGALAFTVPYMNLRVNDSHKSAYWVVPAVEYANIQYCRDAFWISTMLPDTFAAQCLKNELDSVNHYAEYPLYIPIWALRLKKKGINSDLEKVQKYVDVIEQHIRKGYYYSYDRNDGRHDFQYWNDMIAFDTTDVITYNQGLLVVALLAAEELGLKTKTSVQQAIENYSALYNSDLGYMPVSKMKDSILAPDVIIGDLLAQLYLNKELLGREIVMNHYQRVTTKAKTPYGYKILANANGDYLSREAYNDKDYVSQLNLENMPEGRYQYGGSWTLYDMLFLMGACMYDDSTAMEEVLWRASIDFKIGATSYECINTVTGEPWKPNMGWNSAIYAIWRSLGLDKTKEKQLLDEIDRIVQN